MMLPQLHFSAILTFIFFLFRRDLKGISKNYGYDSGMDNFDIKFVETKFHGQGENQLIVVHIVAGGLVSDNANLMCQLLANSLGHFSGERALPPNVRLQVDGVATNWGLVTFAFIADLVMAGYVHAFDMCRNPVGVNLLLSSKDLLRDTVLL